MLVILDKSERRQKTTVERLSVSGYRYYAVKAYKLKKAVKAMRGLGVTAVIPVNGAELPPGYCLPDPSQAVLGLSPMAARLLSRNGQTSAVTSPRASYTAELICRAVIPYSKRLYLNCGSDSQYLAYRLLKNYGVSAIISSDMPADFSVKLDDDRTLINGLELTSESIILKNSPAAPEGVPSDLWHDALVASGTFEVCGIKS